MGTGSVGAGAVGAGTIGSIPGGIGELSGTTGATVAGRSVAVGLAVGEGVIVGGAVAVGLGLCVGVVVAEGRLVDVGDACACCVGIAASDDGVLAEGVSGSDVHAGATSSTRKTPSRAHLYCTGHSREAARAQYLDHR